MEIDPALCDPPLEAKAETDVSEDEQAVYGCCGCDEKFEALAALREHVRTVGDQPGHKTADDRPYKCTICKRTYKNANGLKYHITTSITDGKHTSSAPTRGRPSKTSDELPAESRNPFANDEVRECFPCPLKGCTKRYKQLSGLRYHLVRGTGHEKPMLYDDLYAINPALALRLNGRGDALEKARAKTKTTRQLSSTSEVNDMSDDTRLAAQILSAVNQPKVFEDDEEEEYGSPSFLRPPI